MQLAAGGSYRNQDEKIVLLFPGRIYPFRPGAGYPEILQSYRILPGSILRQPEILKIAVLIPETITRRVPTAFAASP